MIQSNFLGGAFLQALGAIYTLYRKPFVADAVRPLAIFPEFTSLPNFFQARGDAMRRRVTRRFATSHQSASDAS